MSHDREMVIALDVCGAALRTLVNVLTLREAEIETLYGRSLTLAEAVHEGRVAVLAWETRRALGPGASWPPESHLRCSEDG